MNIRDDFFAKFVTVVAVFIAGYFIPFFLIQFIFTSERNPVVMFAMLFTTGPTAAIVNLASLTIASISSAIVLLLIVRTKKIAPIKAKKPLRKPKRK